MSCTVRSERSCCGRADDRDRRRTDRVACTTDGCSTVRWAAAEDPAFPWWAFGLPV